jgi:membrane fusion protein, multidrug efflux system
MRWLISLVLVALVAAAVVKWPDIEARLVEAQLIKPREAPKAAAATSAPAEIAVEAAPVKIGSVQRQIEAVGSLRSDESVIIRPEISGRVSEILFQEGMKVTAGTPLIRLDASIAKAQLDAQRASLILSKVNFERAQGLVQKGAGSQRAHDEALAKLRADEAAVALAQATLDKSTLTAPFDGILGLRKISLGDYVNPGQDIVNLESIETLKVDFRVSEIHALQVKSGQAIRVTLDAIPGGSYNGTVYAIDPAHDPTGRALILRARMPNQDGQLRSGMFARVILLIEDLNQRVLVPETALVPMGQDLFVFRLVDTKAKLTKVKIGQRRAGAVEIVEGLEKDTVIITEGALKLRDDALVRATIQQGS